MTEQKTTEKLEVVSDKIQGIRTEESKLYMIVWHRVANFGIIYCWADSESEAVDRFGYNPEWVEHTIVEINPQSMPVKKGVSKW